MTDEPYDDLLEELDESTSNFEDEVEQTSLAMFEGDLSIENVAFESGFTALSQFYEQFRNAYGITPREMRANYLHTGGA